MKDKTYVLNLDFSVMRLLNDNSAVNTTIKQDYTLLSIPKDAYITVINQIEKDFNQIIDKYTTEFKFNPND